MGRSFKWVRNLLKIVTTNFNVVLSYKHSAELNENSSRFHDSVDRDNVNCFQ